MTWTIVLSLAVLVVTTYVASVGLALLFVSRSALEARLRSSGREDAAQWLFDRAEAVAQSVSLIRTILRLAFFALILLAVVDMDDRSVLSYRSLFIGGSIAVAVLWVFTIVLSRALARYASAAIVAGALPVLRVVSLVCSPLTRSLSFIDEAVRRLTGANVREREEMVEQELLRSIEDTRREGGLDERAVAMLENVVEFTSTDVGEVMTPRTDIDGIELTDDLGVIRSFIVKAGHSRIPVYDGNIDHIVGILYVKDLVPFLGEEANGFRLKPILRQPIVIPETKPVRELLADFQRSEVHMAIVIDEYGGTAGLVTIEDVLEEIVGEIQDEHDPEDADQPELRTIDETKVEVDGRYHIDDLNEKLGLNLPEDAEFDTVAGFFMSRIGHVPNEGESFEWGSARFTALMTTPTHIKRIGVELLSPAVSNGRDRAEG